MRVKIVPFKDLAKDTLFIEAKKLPNYYVFQKTGPATAKIYGRDNELTFSKMHETIPVSETTFGELPIAQFALSSSAKAACGILVPLEVLVKRPPTAFPKSHGEAEYVDINQTCQSLPIDNTERVINLENTFNFDHITIANLNI